MYRKGARLHFVGIGGIGMSGIAEVLLTMGYRVSGSDLKGSAITERLKSLGATVYTGHSPENIGDSFVVVTSSAVGPDNPEVRWAHELMVPVIPRAEMLSELMRMKYGVAVAGTHGKTTTTSLVGAVLTEAGLDPTIVVGGKVGKLGSNAKLGQGNFLVAEADESDGSFLCLSPTVSVITNIDREHMDHYGSEEAMENAFVEFANRIPFYGALVVCLDDPRIQALMPRFGRRTVTYGLTGQVDVWARHVVQEKGRTRFEIIHRGVSAGTVELGIPGIHNVLNSLAAFAVGVELDVGHSTIVSALSGFTGVDRRSEVKGEAGGVFVMDDYGHHPTEVQAVLQGVRDSYDRRVVALFQPHRFSRTLDLAERFYTAFYGADILLVTDIYAAGEKPLPGVSAEALAEGIRNHGHRAVRYVGNLEAAAVELLAAVRPGDIAITLGAGNVWQAGESLLERLKGGGQ